MADTVNLADPAVEPTDEQLQQLSHEAFADVAAKHRAALAALRRRVATLRADAVAFAASQAAGGGRARP